MGYYNELVDDLNKIYHALGDDESKEIFHARVEFMINKDNSTYLNRIFDLEKRFPKEWKHLGMERFTQNKQYTGLVIYGCGYEGKLVKKILNICGYTITYWCDSNEKLVGKEIDGIKVISADELVAQHKDYLVIIATTQYKEQIWERLRAFGFPLERIYATSYTANSDDWAVSGEQYFDLFLPENNEVFIDAGAYNGDTIMDFLKWNKGQNYKIYSLEPLKDMYELIKKRLKNCGISGVEVLNCAAWSKKEELAFSDMRDGSRIIQHGETKIAGKAIDDIVSETDKVTFIKMDIEGAELEALKGAEKTIQKDHPKLAVCIYHNSKDILEIGKYILNLYPDYKIFIRHYTLTMCETVLYAISM